MVVFSNQTKDLLIALVIAFAALLIAGYFDANEQFVEWAEQHEEYELDELPIGAAVLALCLAWFAWRRWHEQKQTELKLREQLAEIEQLQILQAQSEQQALTKTKQLMIVGEMTESLLSSGSKEQALISFEYHFRKLTQQRSGALVLQNKDAASPYIKRWHQDSTKAIELNLELKDGQLNACGCEQSSRLCLPISKDDAYHGILCLGLNERDCAESWQQTVNPAVNILALTLSNLTLREDLLHESMKDPLTGLLNRRGWQEKAKLFHCPEQKIKEHELAVISLDIDCFKQLNDALGHEAGDLALTLLSQVLTAHTRKEDLCCRLGGDEVALLLPGISTEQAVAKAELINQEFKQKCSNQLSTTQVHLSLSAGVAGYPEDGDNIKALLAASDQYLYQAKQQGRDQVQPKLI